MQILASPDNDRFRGRRPTRSRLKNENDCSRSELTELYTAIGETADIWKASFMVRMDTGWKPILLYAVALRDGSAEMIPARPQVIARRSGEQCSIGFQPVVHSHCRAILFLPHKIAYGGQKRAQFSDICNLPRERTSSFVTPS